VPLVKEKLQRAEFQTVREFSPNDQTKNSDHHSWNNMKVVAMCWFSLKWKEGAFR
jgi:hypothetical protein